MTAGPGYQQGTGRGRLRASHADREQVVDVLKAAFVQGRLVREELDERVGLALAARTYDDLAAITGDIPWSRPRRPAPLPPRPAASTSGWAIGGLIPVSLMVATMLAGHDFVGGMLWLVAAVSVMVWVLTGLLILRLRIAEHLTRAERDRAAGSGRRWPG